MNILSSKKITIGSYKFNIEIVIKGSGRSVKCILFVNGQEWTAWSLVNFKRNPESEFRTIESILIDGSYKMFI